MVHYSTLGISGSILIKICICITNPDLDPDYSKIGQICHFTPTYRYIQIKIRFRSQIKNLDSDCTNLFYSLCNNNLEMTKTDRLQAWCACPLGQMQTVCAQSNIKYVCHGSHLVFLLRFITLACLQLNNHGSTLHAPDPTLCMVTTLLSWIFFF